MRAREFITEANLSVDNPGGKWLQNKQEDCRDSGTDQFGVPKYFGPVTGYYDDTVMLPVDVVSKVPGMRGEQQNVREDDLQWLVNYMQENGHLPLTSRGKEYAPFIQVAYDGSPWVNEGNHRIMAAAKLGWKFLPIELRYYSGGEEANGPLSPDKVARWDSQGRT